MGTAETLLTILGSYSEGYRLMRRSLYGYSMGPSRSSALLKHTDCKAATLRITLSRLKARGLVRHDRGIWSITEQGRKYIKKRLGQFCKGLLGMRPHTPRNADAARKPKRMIIAFDIPEHLRKKRDWLRIELAALGFIQLQKSVWLGPAPLPRSFIEAIVELEIVGYMKFFRATQQDIV